MKVKFLILILLIVSCGFYASLPVHAHKFYLSLTEIRINEQNGSIEISMRIFPDDLDRAIERQKGVNPHIATELEHPNTDKWILDYLENTFYIWVNQKQISYEYLGKAPEADAVYCFLEASLDTKPVNIRVENSLLTDIFEDQRNIIQVYYKEYNRGALLDRNHPEGNFNVNDSDE